jgi:AcrR family transcriptional regulator
VEDRKSYRRSNGSPRGDARRQDLLDRVTDDLAANGIVDFSLRRAARAAGTTHKVLLYYFSGVDDLLDEAVVQLRSRLIGTAITAAAGAHGTLAARVGALWPVLTDPATGHRVLDQMTGLAMYHPGRYARFARHATEEFLQGLVTLCPPQWTEARRIEVAELILATLRGFLFDHVTGSDGAQIQAGFHALIRALEREEAAPA